MRASNGSRIILCLLVGLVAETREARADFAQCSNPLPDCTATSTGCCKKAFAPSGGANPLIIAMDRCHQPVGSSALSSPGSGAPHNERTISSISRSGTTVTVTTSTTHGQSNGEFVKISGTGNADLHGTFKIASTPSTTSFTYATTTSGAIAAITTGKVLTFNKGNSWCGDPTGSDSSRIGGSDADNGMFKAYGLVYRLMQRAIPVYWLVNPSKSSPALTSSENNASQRHLATDVDFWVLTSDLTNPPTSAASLTNCYTWSSCTQPVHRLRNSSLAARTDSYRYKQFPVRGGAFLIAAEDRARFDEFWLRTGEFASLASQSKYNFQSYGIDLYEIDASAKLVHQDYTIGDGTSTSPFTTYTGAPVAIKIDYEPPRIACVGCGDAVAQGWLDTAGIKDPATASSCASGEFVPSDATYCIVNDYDIAQGTLVSGGFAWAWVLGYNDNSPCGNSAEKAVFDKLRDFMTSFPGVRNAGHSVFLDASVKVAEGCRGKQLLGNTQTSTDGLYLQNSGGSEPFILRYPANLFMQFGDLPFGMASGTIAGWEYYRSGQPTVGYQAAFNVSGSSLRRLITVDRTDTNNTSCVLHTALGTCDAYTPGASTGDIFDMATYARFQDNLNNGLAFYLPGNQLDNSGNIPELRILLNSLLALPDETFTTSPSEIEVARSSPIVASLDLTENIVFQGTYVRQDPVPSIPKATTASGLARFTFPYITGHLRAIPASSFTACSGAGCATDNTSRTAISALSGVIFDAANGIPTANAAGCSTNFNGSCRSVFTTTTSGHLPTQLFFTTGNVGTIGPLIGPNLTSSEQQTLITRVLAGKKDSSNNWISVLGGVDRSTPAVIGPSPLAGSAGRPTIAYFGATDGMLHAVCATTGGGCDQVGRELWAFIPRTVLPDLRQSTARVDGSPHVIDAYGDFENTGVKSWRTILIFHTGTGRMTDNEVVPAVYAIDVTSPASPKVLWEYAVTNVGARQTYDMGVGLNVSAGTVQISSASRTVAYVQTNNGGTGGAASVVTAIDVEDGSELWQVGDLFPTSGGGSGRNSAHEGAPASGIPGGAVGIDKTGNGRITHVVYGTLYGDVYVRDATNGSNQNPTTTPLLRISADYKPIGVPPAIYQKGTALHAAFATGGYVDSQTTLWRGTNENTPPTQMVFAVNLNYTGATINESNATNVPVKFDLGAGEGGFAQVTIVGGQLFAVTDSTNINSYDFGTSSGPTGKIYQYDFGATTPSQGNTLVVASGAGSIFNDGTGLISASGRYGERLGEDALGTSGIAVSPVASTNKLIRKLWLRTE